MLSNEEAIKFGKEQLEIFGEDSRMSEFIRLAIQALEARPKCDVLNKIPKDFVYDTETSEFYCYRNKYTGEEIHIIKPPKTYSVPEIWEEISKEKSENAR